MSAKELTSGVRGRGRATVSDSGHKSSDGNGSKRDGDARGKDLSGTTKRGRSRDLLKFNDFVKTRPENLVSKLGTSGEQIILVTNHFLFQMDSAFGFYQYRVDFTPEVDDLRVRKALLNSERDKLKAYIFDGSNILYLTHKLPVENTELKCRKEGKDYVIRLRDNGLKIECTDERANMVLNTILRRLMNELKMVLVKRNLYDPCNKIDLREFSIQLWPGYVTSIRQHEHNVLVCCDISHKVIRQDTVLSVLRKINQETKRSGVDYKTSFEKAILGTVILTDYNNKTYTIKSVHWNMNPQSEFKKGEKTISFERYYREQYNLTIREMNQPLLETTLSARDIRGDKKTGALLVPELCRTTGLIDSMRSNFALMKALSEYTRMMPTQRVQRLKDFAARLTQNSGCKQKMIEAGINMSTSLEQVKARIFNPETIFFQNNQTTYDPNTADWNSKIRNSHMVQNEDCVRWALLCPKQIATEVDTFIRLMKDVSKNFNYIMAHPKIIELLDGRKSTYANEVTKILAKDPKLIMCVFTGTASGNSDCYASIKKLTCGNHKVPSQCILQKTITPKKNAPVSSLMSIATKVVMQINCKLGGAIWKIKMPLSGVMVCGFDTSHCTDKSKSYGAFVASMDLKENVKFFSSVLPHTSGVECSQNMTTHMKKALQAYKDEHNTLPERIFFYRDGVGDGQIEYVKNNEVVNIVRTLESIYGDKSLVKFAFIIVSKRVNARFFAKGSDGQAFNNPRPGTIVDDTVTLPERYDFFLISQHVRQGTVSPTNYNVIYDTINLSPDKMQQFTYKMTHLYYNWCGTTRVPAPVQYAHKLSVLIAQYMDQTPNPHLSKTLYYL